MTITREEAKELLTHMMMSYIPKDQYGDYDDPEPYEQAIDMAIEALKKQTAYEQVKWERDMALQTLEEHGIGLGQKSDWIPVGERLPEKDGYYLAQYRTGSMDVLSWAEGWNCHRDIDGTVVQDHEMNSIIAWRPLPAPYKGGDNNG